jgi:hypothetical protein
LSLCSLAQGATDCVATPAILCANTDRPRPPGTGVASSIEVISLVLAVTLMGVVRADPASLAADPARRLEKAVEIAGAGPAEPAALIERAAAIGWRFLDTFDTMPRDDRLTRLTQVSAEAERAQHRLTAGTPPELVEKWNQVMDALRQLERALRPGRASRMPSSG